MTTLSAARLAISLWCASGEADDKFIQLTEGVLPEERLDPEQEIDARAARVSEAPGRVTIAVEPPDGALRIGARWAAAAGERFIGLGARHGLPFDQSGRTVRLGADRRYTGPDCPPEMLEVGGIPQGDYVPVPWLLSSAGYAVWLETDGDGALFALGPDTVEVSARAAAGEFRLHLFTDRTPAARLRRFLSLTGLPALLPEWAYGHWKSRDVYEHQRDVEDDYEGYRRNALPLDAIVIDSPWETQYNTWEFNPHQFPDAPGLIRRMRDDGVRTVVWVTPWVNLESVDGQRPPDPESERLHHEPAPNYEEGARAGHFVKTADGEPFVARWWMGTGSPASSRRRACWRSASRGSRPTTARATTSRTTCASATRPAGAPRGRSAAPTGVRCSARSTRSIQGAASCSGAAAGPASRRSG